VEILERVYLDREENDSVQRRRQPVSPYTTEVKHKTLPKTTEHHADMHRTQNVGNVHSQCLTIYDSKLYFHFVVYGFLDIFRNY